MNYKVISHDYEDTGGHCMVSVLEVWLPDENRTVFVNVGEGYCTITTVNHIISDIEIDDFDKITIATLSYRDVDDFTVTNDYFELCRYCLFEYLKKDCMYGCYREALPYEWLLPVFKDQVLLIERQFVEDECSGTFDTDGCHVWIPTPDGDREISEKIPQHKSLQNTLAACLYRLQATYECNHEVMDADDLGDLLTTIEDVKYYMNQNI